MLSVAGLFFVYTSIGALQGRAVRLPGPAARLAGPCCPARVPKLLPSGSGLGYYLDSGASGASELAEVQARGGWEAMGRRGDVMPEHLR